MPAACAGWPSQAPPPAHRLRCARSVPTLHPPPPTASLARPQARKKVQENGWRNVTVVEGDACQWAPPQGQATLVTFSYSLSSEPWLRATPPRGACD